MLTSTAPAHRDANWDLKDIQQHLVRTQRQQTSNNKKFVSDIARIDMTIEDLMKQVPKHHLCSPLSLRSHPEPRVPSAAPSMNLPDITYPPALPRSVAMPRHAFMPVTPLPGDSALMCGRPY